MEATKIPVLDAGVASIALWLAGAMAAGVVGNAAYDLIKGFRDLHGRRATEALQEAVLLELQRVRNDPARTDEELRQQVAAIFSP